MRIVENLAERAKARIEENKLSNNSFDINSLYTKIDYISDIYKLIQCDNYYALGVEHLCFFCDSLGYEEVDELTRELLHQAIIASRIFLYEDMLHKRNDLETFEDGVIEIAQKAFYSVGEILLTKEQKVLYDTFFEKRKLVVSAPTSFGKSRVIREIIAKGSYDVVAIVVPTNALLSETYFSLKSDERFSEYELVYSTHAVPPDGKFIMVFTPEKFDVYTDENDVQYSLFVFDEVYKVDSKDNRASVFSNCLYKAYKKKCDYYLIGPYFNGFSSEYLKKSGGTFEKFNTDIVQKRTALYLESITTHMFGFEFPGRKNKDVRIRQLISKLDGQTIIYVSRKDSAESRAKKICEYKEEKDINERVYELIDYIGKNISDNWELLEFLKKGVAFHHAGVPKYIQAEIVELFNSGYIDVIICTPTLVEGVNTTAKNVIFYDTTKSDIPLSGFEIKNVVGRSGRFGEHFVGRAIFLEPHKNQEELGEILFPVFDYHELPLEDNIQFEFLDLNDSGKSQRNEILTLLDKVSVPYELLKNNKYIDFKKQINLIELLRRNPSFGQQLSGIAALPDKHQVDTIIYLLYEYLFSDSDIKENWSWGFVSKYVKHQIYFNPGLKELIAEYNAAKESTKIRNVLDMVYRYFEFALPKYLCAFENIYNFVYDKRISLSIMVSHLQYGSDLLQDMLLHDAGLPKSVVKKISPFLQDVNNLTELRQKVRHEDVVGLLSPIEKRMMLRRI